jgi:hypothetical protein
MVEKRAEAANDRFDLRGVDALQRSDHSRERRLRRALDRGLAAPRKADINPARVLRRPHALDVACLLEASDKQGYRALLRQCAFRERIDRETGLPSELLQQKQLRVRQASSLLDRARRFAQRLDESSDALDRVGN